MNMKKPKLTKPVLIIQFMDLNRPESYGVKTWFNATVGVEENGGPRNGIRNNQWEGNPPCTGFELMGFSLSSDGPVPELKSQRIYWKPTPLDNVAAWRYLEVGKLARKLEQMWQMGSTDPASLIIAFCEALKIEKVMMHGNVKNAPGNYTQWDVVTKTPAEFALSVKDYLYANCKNTPAPIPAVG